ncbi:putative constitutive coactivator of PPAR-gamma-like protein 1-like [Apostichopus japonicus]|uniref:Putative constitutive coactivator of PPAR-gamma-like protein 1-like n=1 Tax=Stichopus japonicus TaxID=307972 RepID=A0A2G8LFR7_STIJA|nr:putative constitutive coactivator of PPAR-gamma-like protein 1-like [Apostichopus japonicus]
MPLKCLVKDLLKFSEGWPMNGMGEIKLNAGLDDEMSGEFPPSTFLFRPIRKKVYGILFSCQHLPPPKPKTSNQGDNNQNLENQIVIKEWWLRQNGAPQKPDLVEAEPLEWVVPPIQRLWLGREPEDKTTRLRAFLSCLGSDSPSMLKPSYVPRHALVMCCILRLPVLQLVEYNSLPLFMRGVEMALLVNDATGSPIPWELCCLGFSLMASCFNINYKGIDGEQTEGLCDNKVNYSAVAVVSMAVFTCSS